MNYLHHLDFDTVEEGEINIPKAEKVRDNMSGDLFYSILSDDVEELKKKLYLLKLKQSIPPGQASTL